MMSPSASLSLLFRIGAMTCAVPAAQVIEVMRPLPVQEIEDAPPFVRGVAIIRGEPVPVADLRVLLGTPSDRPAARFVTVRAGHRRVALAVDETFGLHQLSLACLHEPPPLLREARGEMVETLGVLDAELLLLLKVCGVLPEGVWEALDRREGPA